MLPIERRRLIALIYASSDLVKVLKETIEKQDNDLKSIDLSCSRIPEWLSVVDTLSSYLKDAKDITTYIEEE